MTGLFEIVAGFIIAILILESLPMVIALIVFAVADVFDRLSE